MDHWAARNYVTTTGWAAAVEQAKADFLRNWQAMKAWKPLDSNGVAKLRRLAAPPTFAWPSCGALAGD